jgi:hypothetical protein
MWPTPRANKTEGYSSEGFSPTLHQAVKMWPTPRSSQGIVSRLTPIQSGVRGRLELAIAELLPTPVSSQGHKKVRPLAPSEGNGTHGTMLVGAVGDQDPSTIGSYLNPNWVEWLMGFPGGWTTTTDSNLSETP